MGATLTTADSALKEHYQPAIREQLNNEFNFLNQADKNTEDFEGRRAVLSLHYARNSGVGARAESGTLPSAGNQAFTEERINIRMNYGRIQLTGLLIEGTRSDTGSFARQLKYETEGVTRDLKRDVNRQAWGTSDGVIATCGVTAATQPVVLATATTAVQMRQLEVGMVVDIADTATPPVPIANGSAVTITAVDATNKTITTNGGNVTTSGSNRIYRSGSGGGTTSQKELTGAQTIVAASGTLFNVNPSTVTSWASTVSTTGTNRNISETLVESVIHAVHLQSSQDPNLIITTDGVYRSYANLLMSQKRFADTNLQGGQKGLSITAGGSELKVTWERDCPGNQMFLFNTKHLIQFIYDDWAWMDKDGAVLSRVANTDAYEATFRKYHELATDQRNTHGLIKDLSEA